MLGRKTYRKEEEEGGWGFNDTIFLLWLEPWKGRGVLWNVQDGCGCGEKEG